MKRMTLALILVALGVTSAHAGDRPSDYEVQRIRDALAEAGCHGGEIDKDGIKRTRYEIEGVKCEDGGTYEVDMDDQFRVKKIRRD